MSATADRKPAPTAERLALAGRVAEFRAHGRTYTEVAAALGISRSYASTLGTDPDGSQQLARRARYQGTCERCGGATDGSNGRGACPEHCQTCSHAIRYENRRWTRDTVIAAIRRWNDEHGTPPKVRDWITSDRPNWAPSLSAVARYASGWKGAPFATWADAIEAAGFPRPLVGKREGQRHWSPQLVVEELRARAIDGFVSSTGTDGLHVTAVRYFGSWAGACAAAGLRPASERRVTAETPA